MSSKSKNFRITNANLERAKPIAERYQILLWKEDGEYCGRGVELPTVFGDGRTAAECVKTTREHLVIAVASYLQDGETPPSPATSGKRDQQINVRVSSEEKILLEAKASQHGAAGLSEYIRAVALEK
jgi:predicted RNase H-like HicB family nuclease